MVPSTALLSAPSTVFRPIYNEAAGLFFCIVSESKPTLAGIVKALEPDMADEGKNDGKSAAEIRMIYQHLFDEVHWLKRQQWTVTYYTVLVYVALVGVKALLVNASPIDFRLSPILGMLAILAAVASVGIVLDLQCALTKARERQYAIQVVDFERSTRDFLNFPIGKHKVSFWQHWPILVLMIVTAIVGAILVNVIIWP